MTRLFLSFDLPDEAANELRHLQNNFSGKHVKSFHLTLKFFGNVYDDDIPFIKDALLKLKFPKFEAKLGSVGKFSHAAWVSLEPTDVITRLHEQIDNLLSARFPKDERFSPHVTFVRFEENDDIKDLKVKPLCFAVEHITLYKSTLKPTGPVHEPLFTRSLGF